MATSAKNTIASPQAHAENGLNDPAQQQRHTCWLVIACIIIIAVTAALIANELLN